MTDSKTTMADDFGAKQRAFSAYLRDPEKYPPPLGIDDSRLAVYRNAVYANVEQFLADNFPRVKEIYSEYGWESLVRDYLVNHVSTTAVFVELPLEFLSYLEQARDDDDDPEYLYELAHFEWLETLVSADENRADIEGIDQHGDLLSGVPVANPIAQLVKYNYPVHLINADTTFESAPEQPTYIVAFRKLDNQFGFLDLNPPAARLIELVAAGDGLTGEQILTAIADQMGIDDATALIAPGAEMLERLRSNQAILGILRSSQAP